MKKIIFSQVMHLAMLYDLGPLDDFSFYGGIENHIISLLSEFSNLGVKCTYITGAISQSHKQNFTYQNIEVLRLTFPGLKQSWNPFNLNFKRQVLFLLASIKHWNNKYFKDLDLIHSHVYSSGIAAWLIAKLHRIKILNTLHGSYYDHWIQLTNNQITGITFKTFETILSKMLARICDKQIHTDYFFAKKVISFGGPPDKIITIHNGVNDKLFQPHVEVSDKINVHFKNKPRPVLVTIRRLVKKNGVHDLIQACKLLEKKVEFSLLIVGDGPERPYLESLVRKLHLQTVITFLGRIPNKQIPDILQASNLVIIPSLIEASSIGLIEAMLMKKPLVVTYNTGTSEIATKKMVQFCQTSNPSSLAKGILRMLDYPKLANQKSEKAYAYATQYLTIKNCANKHLKVYEQILS